MMKKLILFLFIFTALSSSYSQTKKDAIKELFHIMKQDSLIDKTFSSMIPTMIEQMKAQMPSSNNETDDMMQKTTNVMLIKMKEMTKKLMDNDVVELYDKYLTDKEINDLIAFYKTPSGQKLVNITPEIQKELLTRVVTKYLPELMSSFKDGNGGENK